VLTKKSRRDVGPLLQTYRHYNGLTHPTVVQIQWMKKLDEASEDDEPINETPWLRLALLADLPCQEAEATGKILRQLPPHGRL
jgi:hypothetical protein